MLKTLLLEFVLCFLFVLWLLLGVRTVFNYFMDKRADRIVDEFVNHLGEDWEV